MRRSVLWLACVPLLCICGCGRHRTPGTDDVPPGLVAPPGVYTDIDPRWSHDGKRIAFLRSTPDRHLQLYIASLDTDRPLALLEDELVSPDRPYSSELKRYCSPDTLAWSPDDRRIAFERIEWFTFEDGERLPGTGLWELDLHSGQVTPLALHRSSYNSLFYFFHMPQWSPDGRCLSFVGEGISGERVIYVRSLLSQDARHVEPRFDRYEDSDWPAWRPGPTPLLVFRQGLLLSHGAHEVETLRQMQPGGQDASVPGEIWRIHARDYARSLPPAPESVAPRAGSLTWSQDGSRLAFTLTPDAEDYARYELWACAADGRAAQRVSPHDGRGYLSPVWIDSWHLGALSPHGDGYDVVVVDTQSGQKRTLGTIPSADCDWSPDRTRIVYAPSERPAAGASTTLRFFQTHLNRQVRRPRPSGVGLMTSYASAASYENAPLSIAAYAQYAYASGRGCGARYFSP